MGTVDTIQIPVFEADSPEYEADFCAWLEEQGRRLRLLRIPGLDTGNLAEEIEGLMRGDKRQLASRIQVLLIHLLKWRYQPERAGKSWKLTILEQRDQVMELLNDSPSLRPSIDGIIAAKYRLAAAKASDEAGLREQAFPHQCEWTAEQVLSFDFLPPSVD